MALNSLHWSLSAWVSKLNSQKQRQTNDEPWIQPLNQERYQRLDLRGWLKAWNEKDSGKTPIDLEPSEDAKEASGWSFSFLSIRTVSNLRTLVARNCGHANASWSGIWLEDNYSRKGSHWPSANASCFFWIVILDRAVLWREWDGIVVGCLNWNIDRQYCHLKFMKSQENNIQHLMQISSPHHKSMSGLLSFHLR